MLEYAGVTKEHDRSMCARHIKTRDNCEKRDCIVNVGPMFRFGITQLFVFFWMRRARIEGHTSLFEFSLFANRSKETQAVRIPLS